MSYTTALPQMQSGGRVSTVRSGWLGTVCAGASMCVPVCSPITRHWL